MAIEGWRFLKLWEKVAVPMLVAAGYTVRGDNALRSRGNSRELLSLERQASKSGTGKFTVNLALSHDFSLSFRDGQPPSMEGYEEAVFHARLGRLMQGRDVWWEYGADEAACRKNLEAVVQVAIAYADAWFETIRDPGAAYLLLKKGDLGRENLWHLALYAWALGHKKDAIEWLDRIAGPPSHVKELKTRWTAEPGGTT